MNTAMIGRHESAGTAAEVRAIRAPSTLLTILICMIVAGVFRGTPQARGDDLPSAMWDLEYRRNPRATTGYGPLLKGELVLKSGPRNQVAGYVRWQGRIRSRDPVELVSGTFDEADGHLDLRGYELHTTARAGYDPTYGYVGRVLSRYTAQLDDDGESLVEGETALLAGGGSTGVWRALRPRRFVEGQMPPAHSIRGIAEIASLEAPLRIYRELSKGFVQGGIHINRVPEPAAVLGLIGSGREEVASIASLVQKYDIASDAWYGQRTLGAAELAELRNVVAEGAIRSMLNDLAGLEADFFDDLRDLAKELGQAGGLIQRLQEAERGRLRAGLLANILETELRRRARALARSGDATTRLDSEEILARPRRDSAGNLAMVLTNRSGRDLERCLITFELHPDPDRVVAAWERKQATDAPAYGILGALGLSKATSESTQALERAKWDFLALDQGRLVYVHRWEPGEEIEVTVTDGFVIQTVIQSAEMTIDCLGPDGVAKASMGAVPMDLQEIRSALERPSNGRRNRQ